MEDFDSTTIHNVVKKLIGYIDPVGDTNIDNIRFENLKVMADVVDLLLTDMDGVVVRNVNMPQYSRKRASDFVEKFFDRIVNDGSYTAVSIFASTITAGASSALTIED